MDIVERLESLNCSALLGETIYRDAALEIKTLRANVGRLKDALRPFAEEASVEPMPGEPNDPRKCSMKFLLAAKNAVEGVVPYEPLVKELTRLRAENARLLADIADWKIEAVTFGADTVPALRAENAKLREALKPFAEYEFDDMDEDEDETASPFILMKHLRAARAAMGETK